MQPIEVLERYWNYTSFKPLQEDIINSVLNREDTFALLPTGGGKSLCFQIPALIQDGICIVISPLIALMKDQVNALKSKGIKAIALTSGISHNELDTLLDNCIYGNYKFLYLSPERLQQPIVQERLQQMQVNLIAVDEAHCISQWGNDFRPAYKNINLLREIHPTVNCIALTASAKKPVVKDIIENLDFIAPKIFRASFLRPNISYSVINTEDKLYQLNYLLKTYKGASIVYVRNRKASEELCRFLESKEFSVTFFHGGITNKEKHKRLEQWSSDQKEIMVATTAFGMGIDKANVKTVIHFNLPESIESYYQEAGRAGRDGADAYAVILRQGNDEDSLKSQFLNTLPSVDYVKKVYNKLCNYFQIPYGEGEETIHQLDFKLFCSTYKLNTSLTYNTFLILDRHSIISLNQYFSYRTKIQFLITNAQLFHYLKTHLQLNLLLKTILRTYGGVFDFETKINLDLIVSKTNVSEKVVIQQLKQLEADTIISLQISNTDSEIIFLKPREDAITINPISKLIQEQHTQKHQQIEAVMQYIKNDVDCKQWQLLNYFGEKTTLKCDSCSVCLHNNTQINNAQFQNLKLKIISALHKAPMNSRALSQAINCTDTELLQSLKELIALKKIKITATNTYILS